MLDLLFSFNGRARRMHWWLVRLGAIFAGLLIIVGAAAATTAIFPPTTTPDGQFLASDPMSAAIGIPVMFVIVIAVLWIDLAISVKRWHDRDKSGFMLLILFIPLVGPIWTLVECGILDGTQGPNQHGPSPKGIGVDDQAAVFT